MDTNSFFINRPTAEIARDLLGRTLSFDNGQEILSGTIVEAEAYVGVKDRAAHSYNGRRSQANEGLYRAGGTLYIYSQRQYFFFDVATQKEDEPQGVLIRAIEPETGIETMIKNRHGKIGTLLTNGPGKMMQAFGITSRKWDLHRLEDSPFAIDLNNKKDIEKIIALPRVGVSQADPYWAKKNLRFIVSGNPYVSDIKKKDIKENHGFILTNN
ncbi:DNA-3-methyladenine glycosylase [Lactobacillus hominis]|uniref:Putative 3-methyladenine DNA glycosylase n=1 Tax=Lactobacillus hominis DSM 23910 = CRBIP 24.179 TaxID=1423758 RepID=I7IVH2_9LACO|nr:DNA-3-methyladenine glycosylase [Lactobacillus hominis]KRM84767.1 3-methyladenine DNA glycosylase [Lactobacillus hominis DSM 23910 = CRBIP 24.179]MCT3347810.1 DNA-3-methyladenine glycosylase [Lactobacillus hominis]CCI81438.1 Putative 3-methyladenine DNA glycosylase [Lactobacillus hominis DSM 23910 = CRBIP 24.179]